MTSIGTDTIVLSLEERMMIQVALLSSHPKGSLLEGNSRFQSFLLWTFFLLSFPGSNNLRPAHALLPIEGWARTPSKNEATVRLSISAAASDGESTVDDEPKGKSLLDLLSPQPSCDVKKMSGTDLAYIGDVVFEIFVRSRYVWPPKRTSDLQNTVVDCVRAENQSRLLSILKEEFSLSPQEQKVLSRGRNAVTRSRNNRRDPATYQESTAFEALLGYLYIVDKRRCEELLIWMESQMKDS